MARTPAELVASAKEQVTTCSCEEAVSWIERHPQGRLVDVREPAEHAADTIAGSVNVPRGLIEFQIHARCDGLDTPILLFCAGGGRAALCAVALNELGYTAVTSVAGAIGELTELLAGRR